MFPSRPLLVITLCTLLLACQQGKDEQTFVLDIAHMNDTHSRFDSGSVALRNPALAGEGVEGDTVYTRLGGYPRLLAMTKAMQAEAERQNHPLLTLHGGDAWQGSGYFKLNEGAANAELLRQFGLDAMVLGNHEFDLDNQKLARFIEGVNFPLLAANLDASQEPALRGVANLKPYVLFAFAGNQKRPLPDADRLPADQPVVAVVGLTLEEMERLSPNTGKLRFTQEIASAQATVDQLKNKGVDKVVLLSHVGNQRDLALAAQVNGIDAIIGGHSHSLLGDFSNLGLGSSDTPYAQLVSNQDGQGQTCVVQAGAYAQAMGRVQITFDSQGRVRACQGKNTLLAGSRFYRDATLQSPLDESARERVISFLDQQPNIRRVDEDPRLRGLIDSSYQPALAQAFGPVIAQVPADLANPRRPGDDQSDSHGSDVAPLVAESQYWWANSAPVQALLGQPVDFALTAAGGVRSAIAAGQWRAGQAGLTLLPFKNQLSVLTLKGAAVRTLITQTVSATLPAGAHGGKFPYGGHLRYRFEETEAGHAGKLTQLEWQGADGQWQPLQDDTRYRVVMNAYSANGNDGWDALYHAQQQPGSERVELIRVDGKLTPFHVERLERHGKQVRVHYRETAPNCRADGVECGTDALAFSAYVQTERQPLTALKEEVVTLIRHP